MGQVALGLGARLPLAKFCDCRNGRSNQKRIPRQRCSLPSLGTQHSLLLPLDLLDQPVQGLLAARHSFETRQGLVQLLPLPFGHSDVRDLFLPVRSRPSLAHGLRSTAIQHPEAGMDSQL